MLSRFKISCFTAESRDASQEIPMGAEDVITLTKNDIDGIFKALADRAISTEINAEAKAIFREAEKSEHFRTTVQQFAMSSLQSITVAGLIPKPLAMMCLVMFLLGFRHAQAVGSAAAPELNLDQELLDKYIKGLDPDKL